MPETIISKRCCTCKQFKSLTEFYKAHREKGGLQPQCKTCKRLYQQRYRKIEKGKEAQARYKQSRKGKTAQRRYSQTGKGKKAQMKSRRRFHIQHPERTKVREAVKNAIRFSKLPPIESLRCSCGKSAEDYHHHKGYKPENWLDVIAVCRICHGKLHSRKGATPKGHP